MQPNELSPLTAFVGSDIRLDEAVRSCATFLLWERLYGVAGVSPTADRIDLYCLQQRQRNPGMSSSSSGSRQKGDLLLQRPQFQKTQDAFMSGASISATGQEVISTISRNKQACFPSEMPQPTRKEVLDDGNRSAATNDRYRETNQNSLRRECPSFMSDHNKTEYSHSIDGTDGCPPFSFPPPPTPAPTPASPSPFSQQQQHMLSSSSSISLSMTKKGLPLTDNELFTSGTSHQVVAEKATMNMYDVNSGEDDAVSVDCRPSETPMSEVFDLVLDDGNNKNEGNTRSVSAVDGGRCSSGTVHILETDPTPCASNPATHMPRWETSMEPRRLTNEELLEVVEDKKCEVGEEVLFREDDLVHSDRRQGMLSSYRSPSAPTVRDVSISSSMQPPPLGKVAREMSAGEKSVITTKVDLTPDTKLEMPVEPKRRTRQYCPPAFHCNQVQETVELLATGGCEVAGHHYTRTSGGHTSSSPEKSQVDNESVTISMVEALVNNRPHDITVIPELQEQISSALPEKIYTFASSSSSSASFFSSSTSASSPPPSPSSQLSCGEEDEGSGRGEEVALEMNSPALTPADGVATRCSSSYGDVKEVSSRKSIQESGNDHDYQQFQQQEEEEEEDVSARRRNKELLTVSPLPSFKEYKWAAQAQEALEEHQKRFGDRAPSTSPSSPAPLQVGGFELPQLPKNRHPATVVAFNPEEDNNNNNITTGNPESVSKGHQSSPALPDNVILATKKSVGRPRSKSLVLVSPRARGNAVRQGEVAETPKYGAATRKRSRNAAVSPPPTEEFPLPRTKAVSSENARKKRKPAMKKSKR